MHELALGSQQVSYFVADYTAPCINQFQNIKELIAHRIENRQHFYSIEVMPVESAYHLNYDDLLVQPLFTSITWLSDTNLKALTIAEAPSVQVARVFNTFTPTMSHVTCTQMTPDKLNDILETKVQNVLALRGGKSRLNVASM